VSATIYVHPAVAGNIAQLKRLQLATASLAVITGRVVRLVRYSRSVTSSTPEHSR
jgi:hypothetical protein